MLHFSKRRSLFILIALIVTPTVLIEHTLAEERCTHLGNAEGQCILFPRCPAAKELLRKAKTDVNSLHDLQKITKVCGYTKQVPLVCCIIEDTSANINNGNLGGFPKADSKTITSNDFASHPNFKLLPSIEQCSDVPFASRIVGGRAAPLGSYPWIVRIGYLVVKQDRIVYGCAGSIINENTILTAAHCVENIGTQLEPAEIMISDHDVTTNPDCFQRTCVPHQDFQIKQITSHPHYEDKSKFYDIALIHIEGKMSFEQPYVKPVCLPFYHEYKLDGFKENVDYEKVIVAGFGKTKWNRATGSTSLQHVELSIIPNEACQNEYAISSRITIIPSQLCAGGEIGKDSCDGDSGGPLMLNYYSSTKRMTKLIQIGLVSFGPKQCGESGVPGVYTKLTEYRQWILDNLSIS